MRVLIVTAIVVAASACGSDKSPTPPTPSNKTVDVFTIGDVFSRSPETILAGDTIRWNFAGGSDGMGHNVRFVPKITGVPADIPVTKSGTVTSVFKTKGDFNYVCDVHPGMNGEVIVQ